MNASFARKEHARRAACSRAVSDTVLNLGSSYAALTDAVRERRTWGDSGREKDRPPSFVFASRADPVRDAVLEQWGITVLTNAHGCPEQGLLEFLERLSEDVAAKEA